MAERSKKNQINAERNVCPAFKKVFSNIIEGVNSNKFCKVVIKTSFLLHEQFLAHLGETSFYPQLNVFPFFVLLHNMLLATSASISQAATVRTCFCKQGRHYSSTEMAIPIARLKSLLCLPSQL